MKPHLLPMHYKLGRILGLSPREVKLFYWEAQRQAAQGPQPAVVAGTVEVLTIISLAASAISVGLTIIAQFFQPGEVEPARLQSSTRDGRSSTDVRRYAPREGFDSLQQPAAIGEPMPLVFALREALDGKTYGGIRVNCQLLWSHLQTDRGQQLLRTIYLVGDGGIGEMDPNGFALGNSLLNAYNLGAGTELGSSYAVYARLEGGRIQATDRIAGRLANLDPGNAENQGGQDVFSIRGVDGEWTTDFCSVAKPSTNTAFGVYSLIGNNLAYRISPVIRPEYQAQLVPEGDDGDGKVVCERDKVASAQRDKSRAFYSTRSGLISGNANAIGNTLTYVLDKSSDVDTDFSEAFAAASWSVTTKVERIGGSGTTTVDYSSSSSSTSVRARTFDATIAENALRAGIQWLDANDQIVPNPIVTVTSLTDNYIKLSTRVQYDASSLSNAQKRQLLYTRFKLTFVNTAVDDDDEPSTYYRVVVEEKTDIASILDIDFQNEEFSGTYGTPATSYVVQSVQDSRKTIETKISRSGLYSERASDIASSIAGKQEQWDDAIQIGSLYKIGTALAVCTGRSPEGEVFYSEANFSEPSLQNPRPGQSITATFTVVRPGLIALTTLSDLRVNASETTQPQRYVATNFPHLLKISIATVSTTRPTRLVELIIRSTLGIRISNLCNFREAASFSDADAKACLDYKGDIISSGSTLKQYNYTSGVITTGQIRYSFFRIRVRPSGSEDTWTQFPQCFCFSGISQQNQFNTIRIQFPVIDQWEIEIEPLSGWEIRSGNATGTYILIDDKMKAVPNLITITHQQVTITVYGKQGTGADIGLQSDSGDPFCLPAVTKDPGQSYGDLDYGYTDGNQFVDKFGALAEAFVYPEVNCTAEGGPEHEIASLIEIIENETTPLYPGMAKVGLNLLPGNTFQQLGQFSGYVNAGYPDARRLRDGMSRGPTHLLPDIALELLTNPVYGAGDMVSDDQIDLDSFHEAAEWCHANRYFCDLVYLPTNIKGWIAEKAEQCLLYFLEVDGKFVLRPMFPYVEGDYTNWNQPVPLKGVFGLLQMRSFSFAATEEEARRPIQASGKWREERRSSDITNSGIFPVEREVLVREADTLSSEEDPIQSFDLSDLVTNEKQLIDYLKMKCRVRRLSTHGCTMELTQDSLLAPIRPGDYVQVPVEVTFFNEYRTGVVRDDGLLIATTDLDPGEYTAMTWNGVLESEVTEQNLTVRADGTASPTGIIFVIKESSSDLKTYRILDIDPSEAGGYTVNMIESPVDESGRLILSQNWGSETSDSNWVIKK